MQSRKNGIMRKTMAGLAVDNATGITPLSVSQRATPRRFTLRYEKKHMISINNGSMHPMPNTNVHELRPSIVK